MTAFIGNQCQRCGKRLRASHALARRSHERMHIREIANAARHGQISDTDLADMPWKQVRDYERWLKGGAR